VRAVCSRLARLVPEGTLVLRTDEKPTYPGILRSVFGKRVVHETTAGTLHRGTHNALFPINTTLAMTRDNMGRLRRRSWLVSKRRQDLLAHARMFQVYRNYVRRRFNRDRGWETPGKLLRLLPRQLFASEVVAWRQDWGKHSMHPMSRNGRIVIAGWDL